MRIKNRTLKSYRGAGHRKTSESDIVRIRTEHKGIGKLKIALILFLALVQLYILVALHLKIMQAFGGYLALCFVLDILTCLYVLASQKNGRSKAVWIMIILVLFPFGYLVYFISDEKIFSRTQRRRYSRILSREQDFGGLSADELSGASDAAQACRYIQSASGCKAYANTKGKYFSSGAAAFDDMLSRCASAQKFIFIEYFIIADGKLFNRLFKVLAERAACGVDVRIIYDDMGSGGCLSRKTKKRVRAAGIQLYAFNKLVPVYKIGMNFRDHRKITVIDGVTAYTGGINIADEYVNEKRMYGYWKDIAVRVDGDAARGFTLMFLRQWEFVTKKSFDYSPYNICDINGGIAASTDKSGDSAAINSVQSENSQKSGEVSANYDKGGDSAATCKKFDNAADGAKDGGIFIPYAAGLEYIQPVARDVYSGAISRAAQKIYIMTPYFVPDETITNLLAQKAQSGADVRIILPGVPDKGYVYLISLDNADKLIKSGVKVYTMADCFVHAKCVLTEHCAIIGSVNFDLRSFFQQYENALYTNDKAVMDALEADFAATFPECVCRQYIKPQGGFLRRAAIFFLQLFSPLM